MNQTEKSDSLKITPLSCLSFSLDYFSAGFVPALVHDALSLQRVTEDWGHQKSKLLKLSLEPQEICAKLCQEGHGHGLGASMVTPGLSSLSF